jgi:hypothetical protein
MNTFRDFSNLVRSRFYKMAEEGPLFTVDVSKDDLLNYYQNSFPNGTNNIFRENKEHDCNTCNKFISRIGPVVSIQNGKLMTVWGLNKKISGTYQVVANKMDRFIKKQKIGQIFLMNPEDSEVGVEKNIEDLKTPRSGHDASKDPKNLDHITWHHFSCVVPDNFLSTDRGTLMGDAKATRGVFKRGLEELSLEAIELTLDMIDNNTIYRGQEFYAMVKEFHKYKKDYMSLSDNREKELYTWQNYKKRGVKIYGTAIGTLLIDLSKGKAVEEAVASYEKKVAPENYKRPSAIITKGMINKGIEIIDELGLRKSLERRYAHLDDVSVNNVIFVNRDTRVVMKDNISEMLNDEVEEKPERFKHAEEIKIEEFINNIVPKSSKIEIKMENKYENNLMSLIAPVYPNSPLLFKWGNNFSWTYNGNATDSMIKKNVKEMGGNVDAVLRFSIQWNENGDNQDDLDAHAREPNGKHIFYQNKHKKHNSSGMLDIDIINPGNHVAIENITYTDKKKMPEGKYNFFVNNFSYRGGRSGFRAEIEFDGVIYKFSYKGKIKEKDNIIVAVVNYSKEDGFEIIESLPFDKTSKLVWGIETEKFHKVNAIMHSPNHWNKQGIGNRHYFFILDKCLNPDKARGFYNEYMRNELDKYRKVFEVLGGKMRCKESTNQVSGLGFSTTKRNAIIVRVNNSNRFLKVVF